MSLALPRPLFLALQEDFDGLSDPRVARTRLHRLSDILLLSLASFCCGAESFEDIQVWCVAHGTPALRALFGVRLDNGIPHHDTFRRVLGRLDPNGLEESLHTVRQRLPASQGQSLASGKHVSMDGKEIRGSHNAVQGSDAIALLSLFATDLNLVIAQRKVDTKTNEIPVAQEILQVVDIEGATVTADALHCQVHTAAVIRERKANYVLAVKDNQRTLHEALQVLFTINKAEKRVPMTTFRQVEKGHGRLEARQGYLIGVNDWLPPDDPLRVWRDWESVLCLESERRWTHRGQEKVSHFTRYFISSTTADVQTMMGFVRSHWKIENNLHWIMDVTFGEDSCRARSGHEAQNLATLRRLAAFLLQATEPEEIPKAIQGMSLRKRKKWAGWRSDYLQKVLAN
jgi:predicted transposase YbfD/YdcC